MGHRKAVTRELVRRYRAASKKEKGRILDEHAELLKLNRSYLSWLLRSWETTVYDMRDGELVEVVVGRRRRRRKTARIYGKPTQTALRRIWYQFGCMCGKRLVVVLREMLPILVRFGEVKLDEDVQAKLERISAATIDRLLRAEKHKIRLRGRSHTKPTTHLMNQIPLRTFAEWQNVATGTIGVDLVGHDGGNSAGDFAFTLVASDRNTQWTEPRAVFNKAQRWVFEELLVIRSQLPFPLRALHSDNGSEFINKHLYRYCRAESIHFTRSRAYRKNDNGFVEQKNNDVVRKHVGYLRHETTEEVELLNELYDRVRLLINFFYPSVKLIEKTRRGARVSRRYDVPQTPYRRVLERTDVPARFKRQLTEQFETLNPVALQREVVTIQQKLLRFASRSDSRLRQVS